MPGLSDLSDCILLRILKYIDTNQLLDLIDEYHQDQNFNLGRVAGDSTLWRNVKFHGHTITDLRKIIKHLGPHTKCLSIRGIAPKQDKWYPLRITSAFFQSVRLRCTRLKELKLASCSLDNHNRPFQGALPKSVQILILNEIQLHNVPEVPTSLNSPFHKHEAHLPNLHTIVLRHCKGFSDFDFKILKRKNMNLMKVVHGNSRK